MYIVKKTKQNTFYFFGIFPPSTFREFFGLILPLDTVSLPTSAPGAIASNSRCQLWVFTSVALKNLFILLMFNFRQYFNVI